MPETENLHEGHRKRLRQRYLTQGLEGFQPHEALELLLFYAIPRQDVNLLSHRIIDRFGSLEAALSAAPEELMQVKGVGESAALLISMVRPMLALATRRKGEKVVRLNNKRALLSYCAALPFSAGKETFFIICLDAQWRVLHTEALFSGTIDMVNVHNRIIIETALFRRACYVVMVHNHPSGAPQPSDDDLLITANVKNALAAIDIQLTDHVIVADGGAFSLRDYSELQRSISLIDNDHRKAAESSVPALGKPDI